MNYKKIYEAIALLKEANEPQIVSILEKKIEEQKRTESMMKEHQLTQEEAREVLSTYNTFNGSLESYEVDEWVNNQKKAFIDILENSDLELYVIDDSEIVDYETLYNRLCSSIEDYVDIGEIIYDHFDVAEKSELLSAIGYDNEEKSEED